MVKIGITEKEDIMERVNSLSKENVPYPFTILNQPEWLIQKLLKI